MRIGDKVQVKAKIIFDYSDINTLRVIYPNATLYHEPDPKYSGRRRIASRHPLQSLPEGIVIGWVNKQTGYYYLNDIPQFSADKHHKVWKVIPCNAAQRWFNPWFCLEEDLEVLNE